MYVNITHDTKAEHRRLFVFGVVFITLMALLVALSIAVYDKAFSHPTTVVIKAENAGLQLDQFGDVRRHGVLVGQVRKVGNDGHEAVITVALNPSSAKDIPQNAKIEILPTTLFGQKYINIEDPTDPSTKSMSNGDVIPASRVTTNVELQKILADLFPLLRSIRPADLSTTLYAIATALRGRGDQIGQTMVKLDNYLTTINVHLPTLQQDLALLARVSNTYSLAAPDLIRILRNATTTARTVTTHQAQLHTFFADVTGLGKTSTEVLDANGPNIVRAGQLSVPLLGLLDTYSPEFPCLLQGAARYAGRLGTIFKGGRVRQTMTFAATQRPPYAAKDKPVYADHRGPQCYGLPYPKVPLPGPVDFANGTRGRDRGGRQPELTASRNTKTTVAAIKLTIFVMVSVIVTGTLTAIMGSFSFGSETAYKADFSTASLIKKGDDVRVAGVSVGSVKHVEIKNRDQAEITFKVKNDVPVTTATRASIRYLNLVGDRYMSLEEGAPGAQHLADGGTIPLTHTTPALNLTELFNGFQPLFQALQPAEVNQLSLNLVKVLQGEGGTINSLLGNTASLTNALADRDQLIGQVIDNLSSLLKTTDDHHTQLSSLIVQLKDWMTNLSSDRKTIGASITNLSGLTADVAKLLTEGRPYIKADVAQVRRTMAILNKPKNQAVLNEVINRLPTMLQRQARVGSYGSWYQYYLCDIDAKIIMPKFNDKAIDSLLATVATKLNGNLSLYSKAKRCDP